MSAEELDEKAEELEAAGKAISKEEGRGSLKLWFAVLGSPLAWGGHLVVNYSLEEWFACSDSSTTQGEILGIRSDVMSVLINTAMLAVAVASGLVAYGCWKKLKGANGDERTERARWMAFAGTVEGVLFVSVILLGYLPALFLGVCEFTP